ncbi:MAG: hypothetical protein WC356_03565 [Candidatus Micrarchaeia archaeon]
MGWTTYNTSTPANSDDPREAALRMREIKAANQERQDIDHYWPLTSTQVSDVNVGEHRKITIRDVNSTDIAAFTTGKAYLYRYGDELHYKDSYGLWYNETQITRQGYVNLDDAIVSSNVYIKAKNAAGNGEVDLIKGNASGVAVLPNGSEMDSSAAPTADADIANKKYVDDQRTASAKDGYAPTTYTGGESVTFPNGMILKSGSFTHTSSSTKAVSFDVAFSAGCVPKVMVMPYCTDEDDMYTVHLVGLPTRTGFSVYFGGAESSLAGAQWFAIGY